MTWHRTGYITWTNDVLVHWRHMGSLGYNELSMGVQHSLICDIWIPVAPFTNMV